MTPELARVALAVITRAAPFVPLTLAEMPMVSAAMRALEAEAQEPAPPESTLPEDIA